MLLGYTLLILVHCCVVVYRTVNDSFPGQLLLVFNVLSITITTFFVLMRQSVGHLLTCSDIRGVKLITITLNVNKPLKVFTTLLRALGRDLTGALLFYNSNGMLLGCNAHSLGIIYKVLGVVPFATILFNNNTLTLTLTKVPPFGVFLDRFVAVATKLTHGRLLVVILLLLLLALILTNLMQVTTQILVTGPPRTIGQNRLN